VSRGTASAPISFRFYKIEIGLPWEWTSYVDPGADKFELHILSSVILSSTTRVCFPVTMGTTVNMAQTSPDDTSLPMQHKALNVVNRRDSEVIPTMLETPASPSSLRSRDYSSLDIASKRKFKSYRLRGDFEKPWLSDPAMDKTKWNNWIVRAFFALGFVLASVACFFMVWPYKEGSVSGCSFPTFQAPSNAHVDQCRLVLPHLRR
jgi:hypothetical protein